ncbi:MAG: ABC transporter ATP-binding protein [Lachnospiraceae bacterium]|nr:ABC transporter ATP-binding protein [Lachnospiraceae bacterium]
MKKLLKYLKEYKLECVLAPLFKMLEASFELIVPLVVASLIDVGISNNNTGYIYRCVFIMILLGFVGLISSCTAQFFAAKAATGFSTNLRKDLFAHLMSLSFKEIDGIGTSTMITRMTSDVNQAQTGVNMFLRLFLRSPFVVFGAMIMAFSIDVKAAMIFVYVIIVLFFVVGFIMKTNIPMIKNVQKLLDRVMLLTRENLSGARVIRAFCREEDEIQDFYSSNNSLFLAQIKSGRVSGLMNPVTYVIVNIGIICLVYSGGLSVDRGILTQGQVIALYNYMSQILIELIKLANLIITLNKAVASADRVADVLDIKCSQDIISSDENKTDDSVVKFENVSLKYHDSSDDALENISFTVKKGQIVGIIGGTGSGKTSLVSLIPRFYDATEGKVSVFGKDVRSYTINELRDRIAVVMQKAVLFSGDISSNLRFGAGDISDDDINEAAKLAVATDVVDSKGGLTGKVEQNGRNFSGGQKQRLTIARALAKKADILILDDSASALDFATEKKLNKNIREIDNQVTFIVTQRASSILDADMIIVLDDGRIVGIGTSDELLKSCDVYKEIYYTQFEEAKHEK